MSSVRTAVKRFQTAVESGEAKDVLEGLYVSAQSALAKASARGRLHKNNASRRIARLASLLGKVDKLGAKEAAKTAASGVAKQAKKKSTGAGKKKAVAKKQKKVVKKKTAAAVTKKKTSKKK
jgi:small subunit ribosomal protein S20